jgi:ribosomal protein S18 acetylase RimI-like enzyme
MRQTLPDGVGAVLRPLAWDSGHFGFPVAQVTEPRLAAVQLTRVLDEARRQGVHLVCWPAHPRQAVPVALLRRYRGILADRRATYQAALARDAAATGPGLPSELVIRDHPAGPATPALLSLAVAAGAYSRFRLDPLIPAAKFVGLFETWMRRSTTRELADGVVVVARRDAPEDLLGVVTLAVAEDVGHIGLLALAPAARGQGLGRALLEGAHSRMRERGATRARVVTQLANLPACRLYERAGYEVAAVRHVYHFWTAAAAAAA